MFDSFKTPENLVIEIEGASFIIALPTRWNRAYTRAWQGEMAKTAKKDDVTGNLTIGMVAVSDLSDAQLNAFVAHCIVQSPIDVTELARDYVPLLDVLFKIAETKADEMEADADELVKKFSPSSSGSETGEENSSSTKGSKLKAV